MVAPRLSITVLAVVISSVLLQGCKKPQPAPPPPPTVTTAQPIHKSVTDYAYFTGRTEALASVDLRARVQGFLQSVNFVDGADVKKGALLFEIDPAPFKADLDRTKATLQRNQAAFENAQFNYKRNKEAYDKQVATDVELINATAARDEASANVLAAKAAVEQAKINLSYTKVSAPIDGRMSRHLVDVGNLVGGSEATLLGTIVSQDPMYAYFNVSERNLQKHRQGAKEYREEMKREGKKPVAVAEVPIGLGLTGEKGYPHTGRLDYVDNRVDSSTGTIQVRGVWTNKDRILLPGMFSRIRLPIGKEENALLITDRALGADQSGRFLLIVNDQNIVEYRKVTVGAVVDGMRVILTGLKSEDWVIVEGIQRARPGAKVTPQKQVDQTIQAGQAATTQPSTKPAN